MRISDWSSDVCSSDLLACDGQVLVIDDMLGMFQGFQPKFVKRYAELGRDAAAGAAAFAEEVRSRRFLGPEPVFADTLACRTRRSYLFQYIYAHLSRLTPPDTVRAVFRPASDIRTDAVSENQVPDRLELG